MLGLASQETQGVRVYAGQHRSIAKSGLSTMLFPGAEVGALYTLGDLFVTLSESLDAADTPERAYTYLYWGELDDLAHRYGRSPNATGGSYTISPCSSACFCANALRPPARRYPVPAHGRPWPYRPPRPTRAWRSAAILTCWTA